MKIAVVIYLILTIVFFIDIILSITVLEFVKTAVSIKDRPKLVVKISELKDMRRYTIIWPYVLYKLIRDNVK